MYQFYKLFGHLPGHLFLSSFAVFVVVNIFENLLHYSIGKNSDKNKFAFTLPSATDWFRIILVMLMFASLQAIFTCVLNGC